MTESEGATRKAIETVWPIGSARLIGGLVRVVRDVGLAEDLEIPAGIPNDQESALKESLEQ